MTLLFEGVQVFVFDHDLTREYHLRGGKIQSRKNMDVLFRNNRVEAVRERKTMIFGLVPVVFWNSSFIEFDKSLRLSQVRSDDLFKIEVVFGLYVQNAQVPEATEGL